MPSTGHNTYIHGARGLFAAMVVLYHGTALGLPLSDTFLPLYVVLTSFRYGVELFFAISGYVILQSMARGTRAADFAVNRISRLGPVVWAAVGVAALLALWHGKFVGVAEGEALADLLINLLALNGFIDSAPVLTVTWTLTFELAFYGLCAMYLLGRERWGIDLRLPLFAIGALLIAEHPRSIFFLSGMIVALGWMDRHWLTRRLARYPLYYLALFLLTWMTLSLGVWPFIVPVYEFGLGETGCLILAFLAVTLAIQGIANGAGVLGRLLATPALQWLGTVSYSLYIWHLIILHEARWWLHLTGWEEALGVWAQPLVVAATIAPILGVAWVSYRVLEVGASTALRNALRARPPVRQPA